MSDIHGDFFLQRLLPPGVHLFDESQRCWITEHPRKFLLLQFQQQADIALANATAFASAYRISLWSKRWERLSVDVGMQHGGDQEPQVFLFDLDWAEVWLQRARVEEEDDGLDVVVLRLELMDASNIAVVQVVHLPICLRDEKSAEGREAIEDLEMLTHKAVVLSRPNEPATTDVVFQDLRTTGHNLTVQRRMLVSATNLALLGRPVTTPGEQTNWAFITTPMLSPLEFATPPDELPGEIVPRTFASILSLNIDAPELLDNGHELVKVYASCQGSDSEHQGPAILLGKFVLTSFAGAWIDMSELNLPPFSDLEQGGVEVAIRFVVEEAKKGHSTKEICLAQSIFSLDTKHLHMFPDTTSDNGKSQYCLPTGTYDLPLICIDPATRSHVVAGMIELRLISFAASPECSWWASEGLIRLTQTEPSDATFVALLSAVQRCNPQQADAMFGAATPVDMALCFPKLIRHLTPLNESAVDSVEFLVGCQTLSMLLGYLTDDAMAHPKLVGRVKAALFETLHLSTIAHIIAHLSASVFPPAKHPTHSINWQQARGLCWLMSETLAGEEDDSDSDMLTALAEDALEALCERLRLTWQETGTPAPETDGIAAVVCLSMLLPAILDVLPTGFVVQLVLSCLPPEISTTGTPAPAITALHCARLSLLAQLAGAMDSKRISALCNEETTPESSKSSTNLAFQLSKVAATAIATTFEKTSSTTWGDDSQPLSCDGLIASVEWLVHEYLRYTSEFKQEIQFRMPDLRPATEPPLLARPVPVIPLAASPTPNPEPLPPPPPDLPRRRQRSMLHLAAITTPPSASMATSTNPIQHTQPPPHRYWARFVAAANLYVQGGWLDVLGSCLQLWRSTGQDIILKTQAGHVVTAFVHAVTGDLQQLCAAAGALTLVELFGQLKHIIRAEEAVEPAAMRKSHSVSLLFSCLCDVLTSQPYCQPSAAVDEHTLVEDCSILLLGSEAVANLLAVDASNSHTITTSVDRLPLTLIVASCKLVLPFAEAVQASRPEEVATLLKCLALLSAQLREHAPYLQSALAEDFSLRFDAVMLTHWVLAVVHASDSSLRSRVSTPASAALLLALKTPLLYVFDIVSASDEQDDDLDDGNAASTLEAYLQAMIQSLTVPARAATEKLLEDGSLEPHMTPRRRSSSNCSDIRLVQPAHQTAGDMYITGVPIPSATKITIGAFKQYVALYQSLLHDDDDDGTQPTRMLDLACDGHDVLIACKWTKTMNICAPGAARTHDKLLDIYTQIRNIFIVTERDVTNLLQYMSCQDGSKQEIGAVLCRAALLECRVTMLQNRFSMVPSITSSPSAGRVSDNLSTNILDQLQQCVTAWQEAFSALPDLYHEVPYRVWQLKLEVASFQKRNGQLSPARRVEEFERFHEMLRPLLASMVAGGKWESVRELVALVRPQYESKTAVMPRIRVLLQELKRFQEGVIDHLGRHGECRCIPLYFAVFLSRWPWDAESAGTAGVASNSAMGDDTGVWLLIKSDPVHALGRRSSKALQKFTFPSQSGYHAVLQQLREWFPEYRVMPPGTVPAQHGCRQRPYLQLYPAVPRVAHNINNLKQRRARITHTVETAVPSRLRVLRTASADSTLGRTNNKNPYDVLGFGTTRQLSVDTAMELHDAADIDTALNSNADASWHQIDLASTFTVYIEHQRDHTGEHTTGVDDAKTPNDYFGVLAVELTAQTACHGQNLESWGSPMILADASKATGTSALGASVFVHNYGVHCLEWLSGALETIANEKGASDKDTGVCSLQAIRDSLVAHLEVSLHFPTLSPLGMHSTPSLAAEVEDKLDTMWREQRRAMRKALIRTSSMSGAEMAGASDMDAVKLQVEGDLPERIAQVREAFSHHKQAMLRALSLLRGPKGPPSPLTPPSLSATLKAPVKKSTVDKQRSDRNAEVCLWLESLFATLLDDCDDASSFN